MTKAPLPQPLRPLQRKRALSHVTGREEYVHADAPHSLAHYIRDLLANNPSARFTEIDIDGTETTTPYADLFDQARRLAPRIRAAGSNEKFVAALCLDRATDFVVAAWGCLLVGVDLFPLPMADFYRNRALFQRRAMASLQATNAKIILTTQELSCEIGRAIETKSKCKVLMIDDLAARGVDSPPDLANSSDVLIETSGTTGKSKIAKLSARTLLHRFFDGTGPDNRVFLSSLIHHSIGGFRLVLPLGEHVIYVHPARLMANPAIWPEIVTRHRVSDAGLNNSMASRIVNILTEPGHPSWNMSSLRRLAFGSELILPRTIGELIDKLREIQLGDAHLFFVYSMTETGPLFTSTVKASRHSSSKSANQLSLCLHRCAASWWIRIVGETGEVLPLGETGHIEVFSASRLFEGYVGGPNALNSDGWFSTGDLGVLTDKGLTLAGRNNATINIHGRKTTCEEIEGCLHSHPGVRSSLVFAAPYRSETSETDELAIYFVPTTLDTSVH